MKDLQMQRTRHKRDNCEQKKYWKKNKIKLREQKGNNNKLQTNEWKLQIRWNFKIYTQLRWIIINYTLRNSIAIRIACPTYITRIIVILLHSSFWVFLGLAVCIESTKYRRSLLISYVYYYYSECVMKGDFIWCRMLHTYRIQNCEQM